MKTLDNSNVAVHLGQTSEYKSTYDSSLLVREPRSSNRVHLDISDDSLPFIGYDIWNAYEISGLTNKGLPVTGFAKIKYPCDSKYIVESKSIKLYFNSFNMSKLGDLTREVYNNIEETAEKDLSELLETDVEVTVFSCNEDQGNISEMFYNYISLEDSVDTNNMICDTYVETPELLQIETIDASEIIPPQMFKSSLLKSNCRVTSQPDWGDIYIYMKSHSIVNQESLLRYIISFRDECHFHEEICETVYKRLNDVFSPSELCVSCLYVRRGGIDINPIRASSEALLSLANISAILNISQPSIKTSRQ